MDIVLDSVTTEIKRLGVAVNRLVFLSCSKRKRTDSEPLPAIERYDGPTFQVLRRYQRQSNDQVDAYVLSAQYGLISGREKILDYNRELTKERASELRGNVRESINETMRERGHRDALICAGGHYTQLLQEGIAEAPSALNVEVVSGTIGRQLTGLYRWLYGEASAPTPDEVEATELVTTQVRGTEVTMSPEDAIEVLRESLQAEEGDPSRFQSWHIELDGKKVGLKWAVAQLTGLSRSDFHTDDAKRVLTRLGIKVQAG